MNLARYSSVMAVDSAHQSPRVFLSAVIYHDIDAYGDK
jgi:hypothetical protein